MVGGWSVIVCQLLSLLIWVKWEAGIEDMLIVCMFLQVCSQVGVAELYFRIIANPFLIW